MENDLDDKDAVDGFEELAEPKFRYTRLLNDLSKVWLNDAVSCICVNSKFIALGTQRGVIYLIDHSGHIISDKIIRSHDTAVNQISIDNPGEYFASCSNDGKVLIYGLWTAEHSQMLTLNCPVRSICLEPQFSQAGSSFQFATGDRTLVLYERGFFGKNKTAVVFRGREKDGFIHNISWMGPFIAFANDTGIRVYDKEHKVLITHVIRRHDESLRTELYPASIVWLDSHSFAVGWANTITVCEVKEPPRTFVVGSGSEPPKRYVEIRNMWNLKKNYICGLSFTNPDRYLVAMCVCKIVDEQNTEDDTPVVDDDDDDDFIDKPDHPRVLLLEELSLEEFDIITQDIIEMKDCHKLMCHQYHVAGLPQDNQYFLTGHRDLILMRPCNPDDHVVWLLENQLFNKALQFTKDHEKDLKHHTTISVGRQNLDFLMQCKRYIEAAQLCSEVCGSRKDVWESYVTDFERVEQLRVLAPHLPTCNPQLEPECYEVVLLEFLRHDVNGYREYVKSWSSDLYRVGAIIKQTLERLYHVSNSTPDERQGLLETLAKLYTYERTYDRALAIYLKLGHSNVFQLIQQFNLFPMVKSKIQDLMNIDKELAVRLLLDNENTLSSETVVKQLSRQPELQIAYLDKLFNRNEGSQFADLAVTLYADCEPKRLLPFLRNNEHYKLDKALEKCKQRSLIPEMVFLLGRSGNRREALKVIIRESGDILQAIEFCKEHDDQDLWDDMISHAISKAEFVKILMQNIGTHVDPSQLIKKIPTSMKIPDLQKSLVKILQDYNMQIALQEGCQRVLIGDCHALMKRLMIQSRRGKRISIDQQCQLCNKLLTRTDVRFTLDITVFGCGHCFHRECINSELYSNSQSVVKRNCPICLQNAEKAASFA